MSMSRLARLARGWLGVPLALALLALAWGMSGPAEADGPGTRFTLNARGDGVTCDEPSEPTECAVPLASVFTLAVELFDPPDGGYVGLATQVAFPGLTWVPAATADENTWPDNGLPLRSPETPQFNTQVLAHGGLTGTSQPFPVSDHEGSVVEFKLTCTAETESFEIAVINWNESVTPVGASLTLADGTIVASKPAGERDLDLSGDGIVSTVPVTDVLEINCQEVPPTPTPTTQLVEAPTATAGPTGLPPTGYGDDASAVTDTPLLLLVGMLVFVAGILGLSGWRLARRRVN